MRIDFPDRKPLVLLGENNAGKSNIVRALSLVLGEGWPGSYIPEDHDYFGRSPDVDPLRVVVEVDGVEHVSPYGTEDVEAFVLHHPAQEEHNDKTFFMRTNRSEVNQSVSNSTREQRMFPAIPSRHCFHVASLIRCCSCKNACSLQRSK